MRFVQISDLHIGGLFKKDTFDTLVSEVNHDLKPDVIIISGDLTDDGLFFQFEQAQREIKKFSCKNLIIFPGNHDYRHTGYLLFRQFFPVSAPSGARVYKYINPKNKNQTVVVTTVGTARADRDEGEVGFRQNLWLNRILRKYRNHRHHTNVKGQEEQQQRPQVKNKTIFTIVLFLTCGRCCCSSWPFTLV